MVRGLILRRGSAGASWRRRVDRCRGLRFCAGVGVAADARPGQLGVYLADQLIQPGGCVACGVRAVAELLELGALLQQPGLPVVRRRGRRDGLVLEVPAFAALGGAQRLGPVRAGRAEGGEGGAAGDDDLLDLAGVQVGAAQLDRADAPAAGLGECLDRIGGAGLGHPLGPGSALQSWAVSVLAAGPGG